MQRQVQANRRAHLRQPGAQPFGGLGRAHLGGGADRHVDQDMGRARRRLFRQHAGHQLPGGIEIERAFDADEVIVGRAERKPAAPDDAAALGLDHPAQGRGVQRDGRHDLHRVGRPRRRGDRAAGCLGDQIPRCGDDGDDKRRRAVAGQAADAMLVQNGAPAPVQRLPRILHGAGQRHGFGQVQPVARAGGDEGGQVDIRQPVVQRIAHDGREAGLIQPVAVSLRPDAGRRYRRFGMRERAPVPGPRTKRRPGRHRQRRVIHAKPRIPLHDVQDGDDPAIAKVDAHTGQRREPFGAADMTVLVHVDDRLPVGIDPRGDKRQHFGHRGRSRLMDSRCSGTRTLRPSSWSTRNRKVSAAVGSPWVR